MKKLIGLVLFTFAACGAFLPEETSLAKRRPTKAQCEKSCIDAWTPKYHECKQVEECKNFCIGEAKRCMAKCR